MKAKDLKIGKSMFAGLLRRPAVSRAELPQIPLALLFAPFILRILPCFNAFWLDEIWSWQISRVVTSPLQILTNPLAQTDNNHPLNTLWMYLVGDTSQWWIYRIPSLLAGCAMVLLILWMERKAFRWSALTVCLLVGLSFPLITYSSEARGYALVMLSAVAGYYLLRKENRRTPIAFAIICTIGFLSHLIFLHFLLAAVAWVVAQKRPQKLRLFIFPLIVLLAYLWFFVRHAHIGGAPDTSTIGTIATTLSLLLGGPLAGGVIYPAAAVAAAAIVRALLWMYHRDRAEAFFFLSVIFLAPALTIGLQNLSPNAAPSLQVRYLLIPFTFSLILLARYFAAVMQQSLWARMICIFILALTTLGNGYHLGRFLAVGRGDYRAALEHMAANNGSSTITWSSNDLGNTVRDSTMLMYYQHFLPAGTAIRPVADPTWLIFNVEEIPPTPPTFHFGSNTYQFDSIYPAYGLSGWSWILYKKL
jgi:hypothetical protein